MRPECPDTAAITATTIVMRVAEKNALEKAQAEDAQEQEVLMLEEVTKVPEVKTEVTQAKDIQELEAQMIEEITVPDVKTEVSEESKTGITEVKKEVTEAQRDLTDKIVIEAEVGKVTEVKVEELVEEIIGAKTAHKVCPEKKMRDKNLNVCLKD